MHVFSRREYIFQKEVKYLDPVTFELRWIPDTLCVLQRWCEDRQIELQINRNINYERFTLEEISEKIVTIWWASPDRMIPYFTIIGLTSDQYKNELEELIKLFDDSEIDLMVELNGVDWWLG